jgi:ATP-dependent RNA helicase SUPV3L1/SUV3
MFPFQSRKPSPEAVPVSQQSPKPQEAHPLDATTGGAFSAPTAGERASRVREWLATQPTPELMQEVFKELSARDKGAARPVREKLDELRRAKGQETIAAEWADKAQALLAQMRLNIADALAWQRDAAKAGAPLSREPLAALKTQLADRVKAIEDLQHRVQVQREAAVLLAQRIEVLSTKGWQDARAAAETLGMDVAAWQSQADALQVDAGWASLDPKFPPLLDASRGQLLVVWEAFSAALALAVAAASDAAAALPPVPVWADELRAARGVAPEAAPKTAKPARPKVDPQERARSVTAVREVLTRLEQEIAEGHGKASVGAASALRNALKEHGKLIDDKLEAQAHAALAAAGELEGWQRWRADQLREELVNKAEALLVEPRVGGRKMQETLRGLREQWKQIDQGGAPNHALWKRFDEACNEAHKVVEAWLDKVRAESAEHKAQRLALIEEVKAWTTAQSANTDWKAVNRALHQFAERWREAGHLGEKAFAELQPQWKEAISAAHGPLEAAQKASLQRRHAMIEEATTLGAAPMLRIDAVKSLQQRWQAEAQVVPLDRRQEQKLWDAFRKPIDDAFNRKTAEREKAATAMSEHDRVVLEAAKAVESASAGGDAQQIRAAVTALEAAIRNQAAQQAVAPGAPAAPAATDADVTTAASAADESAKAPDAGGTTESAEGEATPVPAPAPKAPPKPVVAVRGDDRPGARKAEAPAPARGGRPGDRRDDRRGGGERRSDDRRDGARGPGGFGAGRGDDRRGFGPRDDAPRGPRLGDAAFRAQRDAMDRAQFALKKLAAQAHGEALTQLLDAWSQRKPDAIPSQAELGRAVSPALRTGWTQSLGSAPKGDAAQALLRLEMAAEVPTPAEHLEARRAMQLQLLTRRNDPPPAQTWGQDVAAVLASAHDDASARRLQNALKALLRR